MSMATVSRRLQFSKDAAASYFHHPPQFLQEISCGTFWPVLGPCSTGTESPQWILAGTSHGHRCMYRATLQIQSKTWIKLTHPHSSPCQMLALQWLCYQTPHSRIHINRLIHNIFLSSQRVKLMFSIAFTISSKFKISMDTIKFREFHKNNQETIHKVSATSSILKHSASYHLWPEAEDGESHRLQLCAVQQAGWAGPVSQEQQCCAARAGDSSIMERRVSWKRVWGRRETEIPLAPSVNWHIVLAGFEFTVKDKKKEVLQTW